MSKAILYDSSKCTACRACQVACKQWWELPGETTTNEGTYENPPDLSPQTWNKIKFNEFQQNGALRWVFTRQACMHCTEAVCVWVCPTYARSYNELGYVSIDPERCIGCGRCLASCPFGVPRIGQDDVTPRISVQLGSSRYVAYKCAFCKDRVEDGLTPACVKTCPSGALQFSERNELIERARARVENIKTTYPQARLYGDSELGGLHVIYVLTDSPSIHGLPEDPKFGTYTALDEKSFPDWYRNAISEGRLPVFPSGASRQWYLQPPVTPQTGEPQTGEIGESSNMTALWGSLAGIGVAGAGAAVWWIIRRRMILEKEKRD